MYTRETQNPDRKPVENGKPVQGTWIESVEPARLLEIHQPFSWPIPGALTRCRLKEWQSFIIHNEDVYLEAEFANFKYYCAARLIFFDKKTRGQLRCFKMLPLQPWRIPARFDNASVEHTGQGFYFKIHYWQDADIIRLDTRITASARRPPFTALVEFDLGLKKSAPYAASLLFAENRGMYVRKMLSPVRGKVKLNGQPYHSLHRRATMGIFRDYKGFWPYRMRARWCNACGFDEAGRCFGFSLGENQAKSANRDNENGFWLNGSLTLLPPVRITEAADAGAGWVIQDIEGLVDLTFTPDAAFDGAFNLLLTKARYSTPLGFFNGMIKTPRGETFPVNRLWGSIEDAYLRL